MIKVCKFGGSSVADADQIRKVKAILDSDKERSVVVVSAPGKRFSGDEKVTDMLLSCASLSEKGQSCEEEFRKIAQRYRDIAKGLGLEESILDEELEDVRKNIDGGKGRDYAASRGEHLNARILFKPGFPNQGWGEICNSWLLWKKSIWGDQMLQQRRK